MKYPQLVSTRAVNAISDWLVSRLEQLGVEAPLIYSRLLLSLLHSSVQINDPIEFNNLETYLTSRKGNKRNPPCDTDTLKKLTAVQCLMETVSSEQEIAKIENLVDELCEKLNDIEKQIKSDEEEQHFQAIENILNSLATGNNCITDSTSVNNQNIANINAIPSTSGAVSISISTSSINSNCNISVKRTQSESIRNNNNNINNKSDLEDPRKRYYSAFPALSKEMEDSFRISNRNTKALTWPVSKSSSLQIINNSNIINNKSELYNNNTAGVKRKPKRRRNQAMSKGRTSYNIRKSSYSGNCSPTWDTDFEGSWEMGRDLIKEFIVKENNRNRSTSESAAYNTIDNSFVNEKRMKPMDDNEMENNLYIDVTPSSKFKNQEELTVISNIGADAIIADISIGSDIMEHEISSTTLTEQQNNFNIVSNKNCGDEGYSTHENLTSLSELDSSVNYTRRLYERDISNDEDSSTSMNLCSNIEQQQYDFAQFKAKFNSNVEALWKNIPNENKINNNQENVNIKNENLKNINESSSLTAKKDNGLKMNLENFWTNYYNHHYDPHKLNITDNSTYKDDDVAIKKEYENEYLSMPNNLILQSISGGNDDNNITGKITTRLLMKVPSSVFLQDSIWSDSVTNYDDDDSFYANVLKSSYKNDSKIYDGSISENKNQNNNYLSKWSEGINGVSPLETSFIPIQSSVKTKLTSSAQPQTGLNELNDLNRKDLRENMLKNSYFYNNNTQQSQQQQQQEQFTNNNTFYHNYSISLPSDNKYYNTSDLYIDHNIDQSTQQQHQQITLTNHSVKSGFVQYSLIKSQKKNIVTNVICKSNIDSSTTSSSIYGISSNSSGIEEENLLTSDRTHFRPIKQTYADGYTFDISNNYDEINYNRSPSGYLHFDGDKYLEYTRSDPGPTIDDDSSTTLSNITKNGKNRRFGGNSHNQLLTNDKRKKEEFILKFRIKSSNEKSCQTDPSIIGNNSEYILYTKGHRRCQINDNNFDKYNDYEEDCSSDDIESMEYINYYSNIGGNNNLINTSDIIKRAPLPTANQVIDQWSMIEIGKKCLDNISSNLRNSNNSGTHTLWGLCPACNMIDTKSAIPANRLLKDELNIEADEIMSDLKYMQDLYIGRGNASDWDDDEDDTDFDVETIKDCDYYQSIENNNHHKYSSDNFFIAQNKFDSNNLASVMITDDDEQLQKEMFYNVTKLITDFLKPENAKTLANVLVGDIEENQQCLNKFFGGDMAGGNCNKTENEVNNNQTNNYGGLWNSEHNIWKQNDFKPIDNILTRLNNNNTNYTNNNNLNIDSTKDIDDKLNWEYSNLAEIWRKNIISPQEEKSASPPDQEYIEKFINKNLCSKNFQYQFSSGQIKHIDKMGNDDAEILNKLDQKISENISQLNNKQQNYQFQEQQNNKRKNYDDGNIFKQKLNQIHQHSQSLDDSVKMDINNKKLDTTTLKKQNRFDRKRRHSAASQNIIITTTTTTTINDIIKNNSNNKLGYKNNNIIVDGGGEINSNNNETNIIKSIGSNSKIFFDNLIIGNNQNIEILSSAKNLLNYGSKFNTKTANEDCIVDDDDIDDDKKEDISPTSATIITCKYWTTLDATPHKTATFILDNKNSIGTGHVSGVGQWNRDFVVDSLSNVCCNSDDDGGCGGIGSISINPSSILKHVALIARPLTR